MQFHLNTSMNSSRMRTARLLAVSRSIPCIFGGGSASGPGVCIGGPALGGLHPGGSASGGLNPGVVCIHGGVQTPPPVNRMTDRCKNITFPQLRLRAVIM